MDGEQHIRHAAVSAPSIMTRYYKIASYSSVQPTDQAGVTSAIISQHSPIISRTQAPAAAEAITINVIPLDDGCVYKKEKKEFKRDNIAFQYYTP